MPELPEVETVRRRLEGLLPGLELASVAVDDAKVSDQDEDELRERLTGERVNGLRRRGKYLLVDLEHQLAIVHLRMTGQLLWRDHERMHELVPAATAPADAAADVWGRGHAPRFVWGFASGEQLGFRDTRRFGRLWVIDPAAEARFFVNLGPEPLGPEFTVEALRAALDGRRAPLKAFLLDQRRLAGVGNIYADEALFRARLHPLRAAGSVGPREALRLHAAIRAVLEDGIAYEGSSIESFIDPVGRRGSFQEMLAVYGRGGQPCRRCGALVQRLTVGGRGTHFCPRCQPPRRGAMVAS